MLRVTVKDGERALLTRNGRLERVLEPGRHRMFDPARPDLVSSLFEAVETKAGELAVVSYDGRPVHLVGPWAARVFWKGRDQDRCGAHRCRGRPEGRAAPSQDGGARTQPASDRGRDREPRGGPAAQTASHKKRCRSHTKAGSPSLRPGLRFSPDS
jgi:hypothetical protein